MIAHLESGDMKERKRRKKERKKERKRRDGPFLLSSLFEEGFEDVNTRANSHGGADG